MVLFRPWDTEFFGVRIGEARLASVTRESLRNIAEAARGKKIRCLYLFCDCSDRASAGVLREAGFDLVEIRQIYEHALVGSPAEPREPKRSQANAKKSPALRPVREEDLPELRRISRDFVPASRFHRDGHFPPDLCGKYYELFVDKEFREQPRNFWVVSSEAKTVGFVTTQKETVPEQSSCMPRGRIVLIAVDASMRGQGLGMSLVQKALEWAGQEGLSSIGVRTQKENTASCALYGKAGFRLLRQQWIYHAWL